MNDTEADARAITIDGKEYSWDALTENARAQLANIQFADEQLQQKRNEWAIADTARMAYAAALKRELVKS